MIPAVLTARGRLTWSQARELLLDCTCAWADLDGFHVEAAPDRAPLTTHLWAWHDNRLLRLRIDGPECVVGQLDLDERPGGQAVEVTVRRSPTWPIEEGRVRLADQWRNRWVALYEVAGVMPLTFARLEEPCP